MPANAMRGNENKTKILNDLNHTVFKLLGVSLASLHSFLTSDLYLKDGEYLVFV